MDNQNNNPYSGSGQSAPQTPDALTQPQASVQPLNLQPQQPVVNQPAPVSQQQEIYNQAVQFNKKQKKSKRGRAKKRRTLLIAGSLIAVFLASSAIAYAKVVVPNKPENKVAKSFFNLVSAEKSGADMSMKIQINGQGSDLGSNFSMVVPLSYDYDGSKLQFSLGLRDILLESDGYNNVAGVETETLSLEDIDLSSGFIVDSETNKVYVRIDGMKTITSAISSVVQQLGASTQEIDDFNDQLNQIFDVIDGSWIVSDSDEEVSFEQLNDLISCVSSDSIEVRSSDVIDAYNKNKFIEIMGDPEDTTLRDTDMTKYQVSMATNKYEAFAKEVDSLLSADQGLSDCLGGLSDEIATAEDITAGVAGDTEVSLDESFTFDVWLDNDENVRQISFNLDEEGLNGAVTIAMDFRDSTTINVPLDAKTLSEIESEIDAVVESLEEQSELTINDNELDPEVKARNDQRKDDAVRLLATMSNYADDNFFKYPENKKEMQTAIANYMSAQKFEDPLTELSYSVEYSDFSPTEIGSISYSSSAYCNSLDAIFPTDKEDNDSVAVEIFLEDDYFCIDNQ